MDSLQYHCMVPLGDHGLVPTGGSNVVVLNPVAKLMFEAIGKRKSILHAAMLVSRSFDIEPARAERDTLDFLRSFNQASSGDSDAAARLPELVHRPSEWSYECNLAVGHTVIRLRFGSRELASWITPVWRHFSTCNETPADLRLDLVCHDNRVSIYKNDLYLDTASDFGTARGLIHREIIQAVYGTSRWAAVLHAGAVCDEHGAIVVAASSGEGKSTLTAALVQEGFAYLGDDCVPILPTSHEAVSVPTAVKLRPGSWSALGEQIPELPKTVPESNREGRYKYWCPVSAESFEPRIEPVRGMLFARYRQGAAPSIHSVSPVEAFRTLVRTGSSPGEQLDAERLAAWAAWIEGTAAVAIEYGSVRDALNLVAEAFPK